jgi:phospholipid/cholesterol/gamma-HCH transport system substrate-binding protein
MADKKINILVGLVILVALIILIFGINFLKNTVPGEKRDRYSVVFNRVSTLQKGDPIKLNGVTMGRVKVIELWNNKVRVDFDLNKSFKDFKGEEQPIRIPVDSKIRVQNIGLMGERQIEIHLGSSEKYYQPGDIIQDGLFDAGIAEAMGTAGRVFDEAEKLVTTIRDVLDSTIGQKEFIVMFRSVVDETRSLTQKLNNLMDITDPKIRASVANLETASRELEELMNSQKGSIETMIANGVSASEKLGELMGKVESITEEVADLIRAINSNEGTLGAMIHDSVFYRDLRSTLENADSLITIIKKQGLDVNVDIF